MDLSSLEIFRAVAAENSVTRAAERLGRVQSNVTTRLRQLENDIGAELFRREGKRMTLTAEGEVFLGYASRLLALAAEARRAVNPASPGGRLQVGTMESTAASRLPAPLALLRERWPEIDLELSMGASEDLIERVLAYELDCALVAVPAGAHGSLDARLEQVKLFVEELLLVLPPDHPPISGPSDIRPLTMAALEPGCAYRRTAEAWLARRRRSAPALRTLQLGSYHAILAFVAAGGCVGVVPRSVLELQRQPLHLPSYSLASIDTLLVRRKGYRSAAFEAFLAALQHAAPRAGKAVRSRSSRAT